jgi:dienelactone hydrolase
MTGLLKTGLLMIRLLVTNLLVAKPPVGSRARVHGLMACVVAALSSHANLAYPKPPEGSAGKRPAVNAASRADATGPSYASPFGPGPYAVGSRTLYLRDKTRSFDAWNTEYGSAEYRALIAHLDDIGEPRTLVTEVWYPAKPPCFRAQPHHGANCTLERPRRATYLDYYAGERSIFDRRSVSPNLVTASGESVAELMARDPAAFAALEADVLDELASRERGSLFEAEIGRGRFPLIVLSHGGFTGNVRPDARREIWTTEAENLASHGYVVFAVDHTGDSRLPVVFHDAGSRLLSREGAAAVAAADEVLFSQATVPERITSLIFQPGGWELAHRMMRSSFEQRVDDVASVIRAARRLDRAGGPLAGHLDTDKIGVAGFSLGSMTTQIALSSLSDVMTGIGWNNGLPNAWEPARFDGIERPILLSLGTEDALSRTFFTDIPFLVYPAAVPGGSPSDFLFLEGERFFPPTRQNPEPVVRTAYERVRASKLLLSLVDVTHWDVVDDDDYLFPRHRLQAGEIAVAFDNVLRHLPFGPEVLDPTFVGATYETLSWRLTSDGEWVYRPHQLRNYYSISWFGRHLKGFRRYQRDLRADPFGADTEVTSE